MNDIAVRDASYQASKQYPIGSYVSVSHIVARNIPIDTSTPEWVWKSVILNPGETFKVINYINAGFRGIEVTLENEEDDHISGISAGFLTAPYEAF